MTQRAVDSRSAAPVFQGEREPGHYGVPSLLRAAEPGRVLVQERPVELAAAQPGLEVEVPEVVGDRPQGIALFGLEPVGLAAPGLVQARGVHLLVREVGDGKRQVSGLHLQAAHHCLHPGQPEQGRNHERHLRAGQHPTAGLLRLSGRGVHRPQRRYS